MNEKKNEVGNKATRKCSMLQTDKSEYSYTSI